MSPIAGYVTTRLAVAASSMLLAAGRIGYVSVAPGQTDAIEITLP